MTPYDATATTTTRLEPSFSSGMGLAQASEASPATVIRPESCFWSQMDTAQTIADFADPVDPPVSQRCYAEEHGIPRSTLGTWLRKEYPDHLDPAVVAFFRSPAGLAFLRRLVLALLLVFHQRNPCGIRQIGHFIELVELDSFVASSYGALYDLDQHLQDNLRCFGNEERARLAEGMTVKTIPLAIDENFHGPSVCLVGMEPVSNYIVVEAYTQQRDSKTWAQAITTATADLNVDIVLFTADQASGIIRCAEKEFKVQYQPELFHLQRDLAKPVLLPLTRPVQQAKKDLQKAQEETRTIEEAEEKTASTVISVTLIAAVRTEMTAEQRLQQAQEQRDHAVEQIRAVSEVYHPYDRETGAAVTAEQMQTRLSEPVNNLQEVVEETRMGERAHQAVAKAQGWVVLLVGCLGWFWERTRIRLDQLDVSEEAQRLVKECLMASYYWQAASRREKDPEERKRLTELAERLRKQAWAKGGALAALSDEEKATVQQVALECVGLFSRSSSCVEGRNGRLSLFHHGQTRMSEKRLQALTVVHNYVVKREDGTTAAERFFGKKQRDAFAWLMERMPELPHPAAKRPKKSAEKGSLAA
jgi:Family of unknown function (DUF6399)